jgi:hypothetical protein
MFKGTFLAFFSITCKMQSFLKNKKIHRLVLFYSYNVVHFANKPKKAANMLES